MNLLDFWFSFIYSYVASSFFRVVKISLSLKKLFYFTWRIYNFFQFYIRKSLQILTFLCDLGQKGLVWPLVLVLVIIQTIRGF